MKRKNRLVGVATVVAALLQCSCTVRDSVAPNATRALLDEIPVEFEAESFSREGEKTIRGMKSVEAGSFEWLPSDDPRFSEFLRVKVEEETQNAWDVNIQGVANPMPIKEGEWVLARFFARSSRPAMTAVFKGFLQYNSPWEGIASTGGTVGNFWSETLVLGQAERDYPAGTVNLTLHLANGIQSIDIGGCSLVKLNRETVADRLPLSRFSYPGMEKDAPWRKKADAMIAANRKGELKLRVVDSKGAPVSGVEVTVNLDSHAYAFGSFYDGPVDPELEETAVFQSLFLENFNAATAPIYWADWGWANPEFRERYEQIAKWLQGQGIPTRGHVLLYPGWHFAPKELKDLADDPKAFQSRILEHFEEIVPIMKTYGIREYDVTNELRQLSEVTDIVGLEGVVAWFKKVKELDPESVLYINENTILSDAAANKAAQDHYFDTITTLLEMGAPIDGIGMQGHMGEAATSPEAMWRVLDRFAEFNMPIRITEYELDSRDEQGQARYDVDFYTAIFAHPATVGITRWGFMEEYMWLPNGAFIDSGGEYKPNGLAYRDLVLSKWNTDETQRSDSNGEISLDAFFGQYSVSVEQDGERFESKVQFESSDSMPFEIALE